MHDNLHMNTMHGYYKQKLSQHRYAKRIAERDSAQRTLFLFYVKEVAYTCSNFSSITFATKKLNSIR